MNSLADPNLVLILANVLVFSKHSASGNDRKSGQRSARSATSGIPDRKGEWGTLVNLQTPGAGHPPTDQEHETGY